MINFYKLWENIHPDSEVPSDDDSPLLDSGDSDKGLTAVRNGLGLRKSKECGNFWDDFSKLCGNSEAVAALLGVRSVQVSQWPSKIRAALDKVKDEDSGDNKDKPSVIRTGHPDDVASQDGNLDIGQPGMTRPE